MELIRSEKFELPVIYYVTDLKDLMELPIGIPYIYGREKDLPYITKLLEWEVLLAKAKATGLPFNFSRILEDEGYEYNYYWYSLPKFMDYATNYTEEELNLLSVREEELRFGDSSRAFDKFKGDAAAVVDLEVLKTLNVFPTWLNDIEEAIDTNIHNYATFNPYLYNKKLDGMYGALEMSSPGKNLIIIDISGSIPKAASSTCLALAKNMSESFYADLLITGSKSTLYEYGNLDKLDIDTIYDENGMDNDQVYFKKLVSETERVYETAIVFGDGHHPGINWSNVFNEECKNISIADGKRLNKWKINKLIGLNTDHNEWKQVPGYGLWFEPKETVHIENWIKYVD